MRILLIIIGSLVAIVIIVVGIGALLPKRHVVSRSASYRATPEQLFSLIVGPQNWRPDVLHSEIVPDTAGRVLMRETTRGGETVTYELLDCVPPNSAKRRIATENLPYSGTWTYSLKSNNGVTIVRITEDGEVYNPIFRFMSRFVLGQTRTMDAYMKALGQTTGQTVQIQD
ncbi:MAG TPA: SRPBCC family protein [Candidatus Acidoferrales bacterium]|nr:SRPBCC family protein [Candidatus Acidoferrales bacterium]